LKISQPTLSRQLRTLEERCGAALLRRDTHAMFVTSVGQRLLVDARTMLAHAEQAEQRLREDQMELTGHLRLFATIDWGTWVVTPMVSSFLQVHPRVTADLALTNRPLHLLREGADIGILPGRITDESIVARPAGMIDLHLAAAPSLLQKQAVPRELANLKSWPWLSISGFQFWSSKEVTLSDSKGIERTLPIAPILVSEGVTSIREATRAGLGIAILPDWLIDEDLKSGRLARILPQWKMILPLHVVYAGQRLLPARVSAFIDFAVAQMTKKLAPYS